MSSPYPPNPYGQPGGSDPYQQPYQQPPTNYASQPYGSQPYGGADPYNAQQPYGSQPYAPQPAYIPPAAAVPQTNQKALISLILGIVAYALALNIVAGVPAIILGHMALKEIERSNGTQGGRPLALAGLIMGYLMVGVVVVGCLFFAIVVLGIFGTAAATQ